jgi:aminomethyltransferase
MGVLFEGLPCSNPETPWSVTVNDKESIGKITSAAYSPQLACNIGLAMISKPFDKLGTIVEIKQSKNQSEKGQLTTLPFS